jgi:pyruvate/2-oxoglutarate/acetoin dehydrogenase E1 component/TPP-dependent pyruvate/acetoin dehydrogenase alpha subunit
MLENLVVNPDADSEPTSLDQLDRETVLKDYELCCISREASLLARKEVLTGKAKFGIIGDGKEVPQVAMARAFQKGDFRSGYYRDQTLIFALGLSTVEDFFAQLYADPENDPFSKGRQMNAHFATPFIDSDTGEWIDHTDAINISSDVSCTAGQMARALGLSFASTRYRESKNLREGTPFSKNGNEVTFCTIGDASTSEGVFWETLNAAGVLQVPLSISVWDDGYGISVPKEYQTTKSSISKAAAGFQAEADTNGLDIYVAKAWDYPSLIDLYQKSTAKIRETHRPALLHITEVTQPQGHSTSGSHERYKTKERLQWEREHDCILRMEQWMIDAGLASEEETKEIRSRARKYVKECKNRAWKAFSQPTKEKANLLKSIFDALPEDDGEASALKREHAQLINPVISELTQIARRAYYATLGLQHESRQQLKDWLDQINEQADTYYHTGLYSDSAHSALRVPIVAPKRTDNSQKLPGYQILNTFFEKAFERDPAVFAFGEDVGKIGDVNQGFAGLQKKFGVNRIFDTGIREWTIMGQAIGMAMRGLRPIAEIQYLDYLIYGLEPLMDDLATLRYRSANQQQAPAIIRTRGHRLEGIWHAGSPIGMILNSLRGIYVLTPRDMVQAAGFYNTMLQSDDPALIIECLNGYRLKEVMPDNVGEYTVPLGVPEVLREGSDVTLVTYGSCVRVAQTGIKLLEKQGISVELIDPQSLLPFDLEHRILESLKKTNRIVFMDEDVPGGATAYMMREVLEVQGGYRYLDSPPVTLTAHAHRPPYGSDGDYFTKPNAEDVFRTVYRLVYEADPGRFPEAL